MRPVGEEPVLCGPEQLEWDVLEVMDRYQPDIVAEWKMRLSNLTMFSLNFA